jgi:hypothetical protein
MAGNIYDAGARGFVDASAMTGSIQRKRADYRAAPQIAAGNFTGAAQEYGQAGMAEDARQAVGDQQVLDDRAKAQQLEDTQRKASALLKVSQGLRSIPPGQRKAALDTLTPLWQKLNIDPTMFQQLDEAHLTDGSLDAFDASLGKAAEEYTLGPDQVRYRGSTPIAHGAAKPLELDPTKTYVLPDEGAGGPSDSPALSAEAPVATARPKTDAVFSSLVQQESGGRPGVTGPQTAYGRAQGMTQMLPATAQGVAQKLGVPWRPDLMTGTTPEAADYQQKLGQAYFQEGLQKYDGDPRKALMYYHGGPDERLWGPKTHAYADAVLSRAGGQGEPLTGGAGADSVSSPLPGYRVIQQGKPKTEWAQDGKGNLVNANGDRKVDPTFDGAGAADPNVVKMVLEGRYPPPTGRAATDPKWQAVLQQAAAQDPNFNAADYHTRYATRKDFTSGKAAQNITSLNTAIGHIGELDKQIDGLHNTGIPLVNQAGNIFANATGDPRIKNFNTTKAAVASELVRVFRQAGGTEADIKDFQGPLDAAGSPQQLHGVVREMTKLLASRLDAMSAQYKQGLGQDKSGIEFLNPKAQATFSRIMGGEAAAPTPTRSPSRPAGAGRKPPHQMTDQELKAALGL